MSSLISRSRLAFHQELRDQEILTLFGPELISSNADRSNKFSKEVGSAICAALGGIPHVDRKLPGQTLGTRFEIACRNFLRSSFPSLENVRPGNWEILHVGSDDAGDLSDTAQYAHLNLLSEIASRNSAMRAALGTDYMVAPDVVMLRTAEPDDIINRDALLVEENEATHADLRARYQPLKLMHASISCKWTMRSDRAQNTRTEALNLLRNRKGRTPHVVAVTGEPTPSRISSLALGTGDIDCTYHFALYELMDAVEASGNSEGIDLLNIMVEGKRLKDITDLPFDLAV